MSVNKATFFLIAESKTKLAQKHRNIHAKSVKRSVVFCIVFQGSKNSVKRKPETSVYDMLLSNLRRFLR